MDSNDALPPLPVLPLLAECAKHPAHRYAYERLIARRLKWVRTRLVGLYGEAYSQRSVAAALGRSQTWLSNLENAHRRLDANELRTLTALYLFAPGAILSEPFGDEEIAIYSLHLGEWWDSHPGQPEPPVVVLADGEHRDAPDAAPRRAD